MRAHRRVALLVTLGAMLALVAVTVVARDGERRTRTDATTTTTLATTSTSTTSTSTTTWLTTTTTVTSTTSGSWSGVAVAVDRGPATARVVALTFDAGSDAGFAAQILDTLAAEDVPASFGLTGTWAADNPALARRIVLDGHQVVNHSWSHPSFTGRSTGTAPLTRQERLSQLARAEAAIRSVAGVDALPWFRPPYGDIDATVLADVGSAGYRYAAMWTVDSLGWKGAPRDEIIGHCLDRAEPGAIYLFHVGSASADAAALPAIIDGLRAQGYGFATLSDLVGG